MPCDDKGFTLLELILVMLIVSFSLVALAPALEQVIARQRLENSAEMMGWVLRSAQQKAIYSGQSQMVRFYYSNNSYLMDTTRYYLDGAQYAALPNFPTRIGQVPACIFQPSGIPRAGGTVVLMNEEGQTSYVIVSPVAGRIRVSDHPPASW
ncbi:MAG: prepilin-type N-terminal cleavage/methylation domain-containing protein [Syntrophomonadaceae bacterium]|jgi:prepilin-type N-terminal cleavage/methylation domain-containing protein|nr:prepilin-type N-terminal cleavage/methylation domain-containing protein [Syntrophomonadaceae bacterium]